MAVPSLSSQLILASRLGNDPAQCGFDLSRNILLAVRESRLNRPDIVVKFGGYLLHTHTKRLANEAWAMYEQTYIALLQFGKSSSDSDEMPFDYVTLLGDVIASMPDRIERFKLHASFDYRFQGAGCDEQLISKFIKSFQHVLDEHVPHVMAETMNAVDGLKSSKHPTESQDHDPVGSGVANPSTRKQIKSKARKRRDRLQKQAARGGLSIITQFGVERSMAQLGGKDYQKRLRQEQGRLLDQIRIVSAQEALAN